MIQLLIAMSIIGLGVYVPVSLLLWIFTNDPLNIEERRLNIFSSITFIASLMILIWLLTYAYVAYPPVHYIPLKKI